MFTYFLKSLSRLCQYQKIREITAGHLYQGLGQSPQSFLMFVTNKMIMKLTYFLLQMSEIIDDINTIEKDRNVKQHRLSTTRP